jgi:hypothetical protein
MPETRVVNCPVGSNVGGFLVLQIFAGEDSSIRITRARHWEDVTSVEGYK